jgi:hypothetical protein
MCPGKLIVAQLVAGLFSQLPNMAAVGLSGVGFMKFPLIFGAL